MFKPSFNWKHPYSSLTSPQPTRWAWLRLWACSGGEGMVSCFSASSKTAWLLFLPIYNFASKSRREREEMQCRDKKEGECLTGPVFTPHLFLLGCQIPSHYWLMLSWVFGGPPPSLGVPLPVLWCRWFLHRLATYLETAHSLGGSHCLQVPLLS